MRTKPADQSVLLASILLQLRGQHASSRSTLAKITKLSPSTVGIYVDLLTQLGYLTESGLEQGAMGRPKRKLSIVKEAGWFAGIEFNAERIQAVRVDFSGQKDASLLRSLPPGATTQHVVQEICEIIQDLGTSATGEMMGIGLGVPGLVDVKTGVGLHYSFISDWKKVPIVQELKKHFSVRITLENNLRAIALAERWFGGGRKLDDYVILGPRSGFGIAIMKNGQLVRGSHHAAGEIGRWPWPLNGNTGEVHDVLTAPAVWRKLSGAQETDPLPVDLHAALQDLSELNNEVRQQIVSDYARVIGLVHLILDAKTYFLHGPLTALGTSFCQEITDQVANAIPALESMTPQIIPSLLGDDAGALGAASLAMEAWLPEQHTFKV
jgi:predicted NBD/HSP70 family sugar kinase